MQDEIPVTHREVLENCRLSKAVRLQKQVLVGAVVLFIKIYVQGRLVDAVLLLFKELNDPAYSFFLKYLLFL